MGYIAVQCGGSFVDKFGIEGGTKMFTAMEHGHADAVAQAIEYLSGVVLPRATALDHELQAEGKSPNQGFTSARISE